MGRDRLAVILGAAGAVGLRVGTPPQLLTAARKVTVKYVPYSISPAPAPP